ncbi:hypothetical protein ACFSX9_04610 [Flavobacterium ardleyense]|uniref:Uncharacterized protein n=1 Tax=Flavobacterium ardleyense TaxID=2038737 RepID=A0ABW5Z6U5_9FLAO
MFQLYKKRDFSSLVGDTFNFFKLEGKNYFKNYFIINGSLLLLLVVIFYFFTSIFIQGALTNIQTPNEESFYNEMYSNLGLFIGLGTLMLLLIIVISMLNYSFPVAYLKLMEQNKERNFENLIQYFKSKVGRIIIFFLLSIVVLFPLLFVVMFLTFLSVFILIGIPLIILLTPTLMSFVSLFYYTYITEEIGYFEAFGKAFEMLKKNYFPIVGATFIMHLITQITLGIFTIIPYIIGMIFLFTNPEAIENEKNNGFSAIAMILVAIIIIATIFNYTLQNLMLVNQGITYYSCKEELENVSLNKSIDLIGTDEA